MLLASIVRVPEPGALCCPASQSWSGPKTSNAALPVSAGKVNVPTGPITWIRYTARGVWKATASATDPRVNWHWGALVDASAPDNWSPPDNVSVAPPPPGAEGPGAEVLAAAVVAAVTGPADGPAVDAVDDEHAASPAVTAQTPRTISVLRRVAASMGRILFLQATTGRVHGRC